MLYLVGTGLLTENDLTLKMIKIMQDSKFVYLENYTSKTNIDFQNLEKMTGKKIIFCKRDKVENDLEILLNAQKYSVVLLIIGTPLFATTHSQLLVDAKERNIEVKVLHNASVMNVMGCFGLFSYNFGRTVSIPFFDKVKFTSFFDYIKQNFSLGLHTLCLLDIKVEENRYMDPNTAISQLQYVIDNDVLNNIFPDDYKIFVISRFGTETEKIHFNDFENLYKMEFGEPLHSLILPGRLEVVEKEHIDLLFNK